MTGVNAVEIRMTSEPDVDPDGAILRVEACGICGTDARTFFNGDPKAPAPWILGHEPVGVIEDVGPAGKLPSGVKKGDRVFLGSILTCGECRWCTEGFQNLCDHHLLYGYDPFPGAYAEYAPVPAIAMKNVIPLPPDLPSDLATVADPFACALNGVEVLDVRLGDTVVILGAGPIASSRRLVTRHTVRESRSRLRALVADDNPVNRTLAVRLLEGHGHSVVAVGDGREALDALERERFDLALFDLEMPRVDGLEATAEIRRREGSADRHLPIIELAEGERLAGLDRRERASLQRIVLAVAVSSP